MSEPCVQAKAKVQLLSAPKEYADRATLWNAVELSEKGQKSRLARMLNASLPNDSMRPITENEECVPYDSNGYNLFHAGISQTQKVYGLKIILTFHTPLVYY